MGRHQGGLAARAVSGADRAGAPGRPARLARVAEKLWALDLPSVRPLATFGNFSGASFFTGFFAGFLVGLAVAVADGLADEVCELLGVG